MLKDELVRMPLSTLGSKISDWLHVPSIFKHSYTLSLASFGGYVKTVFSWSF